MKRAAEWPAFREVFMPLKWEPGTNPYVHNYFGKLRIGPNVRPAGILQRAKGLVQTLNAGGSIELRGLRLDEHSINEASRKLGEPAALAQELLLVHPPLQGDNKNLKVLVARVGEAATLAEARAPLSLLHPAAIFWFTPLPGPECAALPDWDAFAFTGPLDAADLDLDIVFDF